MASVQGKLFQYIDEHLPLYIEKLMRLCALPGTATHHRNMHEMREIVIAQLQSQGFKTQVVGNDIPLIYAELHTGAPQTLLFYNHYDIAPPGLSEQGQHPPFAPYMDNGALYARGAADDTGNIAACLASLDAYQQAIGPLPVNVKWLLDGEGEIGSPHLPAILEQYRSLFQADGCIWGSGSVAEDGTPILALGSKGLLSVELAIQTSKHNLPSMYDAIFPNALWRLIWALSSLKNAQEEVLIEGFYDTLTSLEDRETELLHALPDDVLSLAQSWDIERPLFGLEGFRLHYVQYLTPTCTVNSISSSDTPHYSTQPQATIPAQAKATLDFHLMPDQDPGDIFAKLQQHLTVNGFSDISVQNRYESRPTRTSLDAPLVQVARRAVRASCGREPYILPLGSGSYPMYLFQHALKLPIVSIGAGHPGANVHLPNEHIRLHDFAMHIKQLTMILEGMGDATHTTQ